MDRHCDRPLSHFEAGAVADFDLAVIDPFSEIQMSTGHPRKRSIRMLKRLEASQCNHSTNETMRRGSTARLQNEANGYLCQ